MTAHKHLPRPLDSLVFFECLLCARHCANQVTYTVVRGGPLSRGFILDLVFALPALFASPQGPCITAGLRQNHTYRGSAQTACRENNHQPLGIRVGNPLNSMGDEPAKSPCCHTKGRLAFPCLCLGRGVREPVPGSTGSGQEELAALAQGRSGPRVLPPSGWRDG